MIDDDAELREVIAHTLAPLHEVAQSGDGSDALVRFGGGRRFDLILSDLNMPKLGGAQLYWQLAQLMPAQARRIVFMSGNVNSHVLRELLRVIDNPYIDKPFTPRELRILVHRLLSAWGPIAG